MKGFHTLRRLANKPLFLILLFSFGIRIYNLHNNSPFLDEAQYLILGRKILSGHWQEANPFSWVGGNPLFYPTLAAIFGFFGIIGARFLSVVLGTLSVYLTYDFAKNLQITKKEKTDTLIGLIAATFLGSLAIPIYLSRLAIYDMLSFTLFLLGLVFLQRGLVIKNPELWQRENRFFVSAVAFFFSFLAKYITLILFPLILAWGFYNSRKLGKEARSFYLKYFAAILIALTVGYIVWNFSVLSHFRIEQIADPQNRSKEIVAQFITYTFFPLFVTFFSIITFILKKQFIPLLLVMAALVIPLVHIVTNNIKAIDQHTFLSLIFLLPLASYVFVLIIEKKRLLGSVVIILVLIGISLYSKGQLRKLESSWPNTDAVMEYLKSSTTNHERILSSQDDITTLALSNLNNENIIGIFNFTYKNYKDGKAYTQALQDGYFHYILLDDHAHFQAEQIAKAAITSHYKQVYNNNGFLVYTLENQ